jgi:flagellar basal body-associated protein FliL
VNKLIRTVVIFVVVIVVIAGVNRAVQWFLQGGKEAAADKAQIPAPTNPSPTKK